MLYTLLSEKNRELIEMEKKVREERLEQQVAGHNKMLKLQEEENLKKKKIKKKIPEKIRESNQKYIYKLNIYLFIIINIFIFNLNSIW